MTRLWYVCALVLVLSRGAAAQDAQGPDTDTTTGPVYRTHEEVVVTAPAPTDEPRRVNDARFWAVSGLLGTAMLLDTKSTFDVMGRCDRCYEANPYVAPFVNRGPGVAITAGAAFDVGVMAVAARMKRSPQARFHRIWWVIPVALTTGHLLAYRHNQGVGR